jgi:hypothetical protein
MIKRRNNMAEDKVRKEIKDLESKHSRLSKQLDDLRKGKDIPGQGNNPKLKAEYEKELRATETKLKTLKKQRDQKKESVEQSIGKFLYLLGENNEKTYTLIEKESDWQEYKKTHLGSDSKWEREKEEGEGGKCPHCKKGYADSRGRCTHCGKDVER